jgi:hypothetical protein
MGGTVWRNGTRANAGCSRGASFWTKDCACNGAATASRGFVRKGAATARGAMPGIRPQTLRNRAKRRIAEADKRVGDSECESA